MNIFHRRCAILPLWNERFPQIAVQHSCMSLTGISVFHRHLSHRIDTGMNPISCEHQYKFQLFTIVTENSSFFLYTRSSTGLYSRSILLQVSSITNVFTAPVYSFLTLTVFQKRSASSVIEFESHL